MIGIQKVEGGYEIPSPLYPGKHSFYPDGIKLKPNQKPGHPHGPGFLIEKKGFTERRLRHLREGV